VEQVGGVHNDRPVSKAFDVVHYSILLRKLEGYGIRNMMLKWFASYLEGRRQKVFVGSAQSDWSTIVPQGSLLGPLLFIIYVNDLPHVVKQCKVKQYADDTTLYCSCDDPANLQCNTLPKCLIGYPEQTDEKC